jgi:hypothetical protein
MCVEVLASLPPIRQRLSFLNVRFLVLALVKPNDLLMVKLEELHRIWMNSNCLPEWQIVCECRIESRTHFFKEFDLHLVDLTFVPRVHNGVRMGLRGVDESLFPIIAPRLLGEVLGELQGPTAIYTDGSKTEGLVEIGIFLDDRYSYRLRLPGHCSIFTAEMCAIHFACDLIESKPMGALRTLFSRIDLPLLRD